MGQLQQFQKHIVIISWDFHRLRHPKASLENPSCETRNGFEIPHWVARPLDKLLGQPGVGVNSTLHCWPRIQRHKIRGHLRFEPQNHMTKNISYWVLEDIVQSRMVFLVLEWINQQLE